MLKLGTRAAVWLPFLLMGSCTYIEQIERHEKTIEELQRKQQALNDALLSMRREHDELARQVGCPNPTVREFMRACATHSNFECAPQEIENTMKLLANTTHVLAFVRPDETGTLTIERVGQIKALLRSHARLSTTRVLVVAMPAGPTAEDTVKAEAIARGWRNQIVQSLYPAVRPTEAPLPALPPLTLGCNQREEILRRYKLAQPGRDKPLPGEPGDRERRILLWFFLVDC